MEDENINGSYHFYFMKSIKKTYANEKIEIDFKDIDRQLLEGFECSSFNNQDKKFLSMIREQTNSALNNLRYWSTST